ncbi:Phospholipase/carboxylesterase/thioesterase [Penicillium rubens]|uniref:Phospholipase/carboxylesterase/thioesterase n=1 Tax=Penicillium rubens TaxID=1108849 RepID=UPI002A5A20F3|nr:Phospholipase/carboxylesterase/thioesterase [Penicillium rubens]KAJ5839529.1 Phospholipase/carboxylesterase/thioesterase [Penicillium rubens]KAJ5867526.1 Phospholipase/carboxylesterase/thioesterase [Penicillium rubens]
MATALWTFLAATATGRIQVPLGGLLGFYVRVDWQEFTSAEGDGYWVKEPEGFDHILKFLEG